MARLKPMGLKLTNFTRENSWWSSRSSSGSDHLTLEAANFGHKDPGSSLTALINWPIQWYTSRVNLLTIWVCLKMLCTPLYPMFLLIIIPFLNGYFIGNIPYFQTNLYLSITIPIHGPMVRWGIHISIIWLFCMEGPVLQMTWKSMGFWHILTHPHCTQFPDFQTVHDQS